MAVTPVQLTAPCGAAVQAHSLGSIAADVTGDGHTDHAFVVRSRCGWTLHLISRGRIYRLRLASPASAPRLEWSGNLDRRAGKELVVESPTNGDTTLDRVVTFADARLRVMRLRPPTSGLMRGAGGAYGLGWGCLRPGVIATIVWGQPPPTIGFSRIYFVHGLTWRLARTSKVRIRTGLFPPWVRNPVARCR